MPVPKDRKWDYAISPGHTTPFLVAYVLLLDCLQSKSVTLSKQTLT